MKESEHEKNKEWKKYWISIKKKVKEKHKEQHHTVVSDGKWFATLWNSPIKIISVQFSILRARLVRIFMFINFISTWHESRARKIKWMFFETPKKKKRFFLLFLLTLDSRPDMSCRFAEVKLQRDVWEARRTI
jgi:hypothetical protein